MINFERILLKVLFTILLPLAWLADPNRSHICSWRCAGMDHQEPIKFYPTLLSIWSKYN